MTTTWKKELAKTKKARSYYRSENIAEAEKILNETSISWEELGIKHESTEKWSDKYTYGLWTVGIHVNSETGWMEYDGCDEGGLWFTDGELTDYDGCYGLSNEFLLIIRALGYKMDDSIYA